MSGTALQLMREARAAVSAGIAWVLAIWIGLRTGIDPTLSASPTAEFISRLSVVLGNVGGLFTLLIVAIGLGTISQQVFRAPSIWIANLATLLVAGTEAIVLKILAWPKKEEPKLRRYAAWEPVAVDLARRIMSQHSEEVIAAAPSGMESEFEQSVYAEIDRLVFRELQPPTGDEHLRSLDDQAGIRLAVVIPVASLVAVATFKLSPYFAVFTPAPFVIAFQAGAIRSLRDLALQRDIWRRIDLGAIASELNAQPSPT